MVGKKGIEPSSLGVSDPRSDLLSYLPSFFYFTAFLSYFLQEYYIKTTLFYIPMVFQNNFK